MRTPTLDDHNTPVCHKHARTCRNKCLTLRGVGASMQKHAFPGSISRVTAQLCMGEVT